MVRGGRLVAALVVPCLLAAHARGQAVNPATKAQEPVDQEQVYVPTHSWEVPATIVTGKPLSQFVEEDPIGPYGQPRWTARRLFPTTRIYVIPPGQMEFEFWTRVKTPREGPSTVEHQFEVEFGLPHRFQLDLYAVTEKTGSQGELDLTEEKFEIRYALADWGELWLNPTAYFEYVERNAESDKIEAKLLLGEEIAEGWHFGSNLVYEHELGGELENEYELTLGVARTIIDQRFSLGAEVKAALVDTHADRGDFAQELEIGPSLQYRPLPHMHIDFAPLIGIGHDSRAADLFLVVGWEI